MCPADGTALVEIPLALPRPGNVFDGQYVILEVIGKGGMATIYRGFDIESRHQCALKVLKSKFSGEERAVCQFFNEARVARRLEHPNIIRTYEYGRTAVGYLYIAMELLQGQTLSQLLREKSRLDVGRAIGIFTQVMCALDCAHAAGTVHRDLKPENIFLAWQDGREVVKLLDFGIAQFAGLTHVASRDVCGTPAYMAPEQIRGRETGPQADLYSAGIVLFEMLAGFQPFTGQSPMDVLRHQLKDEPPCLLDSCPEVPLADHLSALVARLLRKRPVDRLARAADVLAYLSRMTEPGFEPGQTLRSSHPDAEDVLPLRDQPPAADEAGSTSIVLETEAFREEAGFVPESVDLALVDGRPVVRTDACGIHRQRYWLADAAGDTPQFRLVGCLDPDRLGQVLRQGPAIRLQEVPRINLAPGEESALLEGLAPELAAHSEPSKEEAAPAAVEAPLQAEASTAAANVELCLLHVRLVSLVEETEREHVDIRAELADPLDRWFALLDRLGGLVCYDSGSDFKVLFGYSDNGLDFTRSAMEAACSLSCLVDEAAGVAGRPYAVRTGLASGRVYFNQSADGPLDWLIKGSSVDLAVRLSRIAPPGGVLACDATMAAARSFTTGQELAGISARGGAKVRTFLVQELSVRPQTVALLLDALCAPMGVAASTHAPTQLPVEQPSPDLGR